MTRDVGHDSRDDANDGFTHLDAAGRARMVDVGDKAPTRRVATARAVVELGADLQRRLFRGDLPKGEAIGVARVAAIQAAKETSRLIPMCHALALSGVRVDIDPLGDTAAEIVVEVRCQGPTGVEMEALTAASVAALTLYDMCKAVERGIRIGPIELLTKSGGKSGDWQRDAGPPG